MLYVYSFAISVDDGDPVIIRRNLDSFDVLVLDLQSSVTAPEVDALADTLRSSVEPRQPPAASALEKSISICIRNPMVVRTTAMSRFLWNWEESPTLENRGSLCAENFILQAADLEQSYVPPRTSTSSDYMMRKGDVLVWKFRVSGGYDIAFGALFRETPGEDPHYTQQRDSKELASESIVRQVSSSVFDQCVADGLFVGDLEAGTAIGNAGVSVAAPMKRITTPGAEFAIGSFQAVQRGACRLIWENNYSRINGKYIERVVVVAGADVMEAARAAAEDQAETQMRLQSQVSSHARIFRLSGVLKAKI